MHRQRRRLIDNYRGLQRPNCTDDAGALVMCLGVSMAALFGVRRSDATVVIEQRRDSHASLQQQHQQRRKAERQAPESEQEQEVSRSHLPYCTPMAGERLATAIKGSEILKHTGRCPERANLLRPMGRPDRFAAKCMARASGGERRATATRSDNPRLLHRAVV